MTNSRALTQPARAFLALAEPAGRLDTGPHTANLLAELAQLVNDAALNAARARQKEVTANDIMNLCRGKAGRHQSHPMATYEQAGLQDFLSELQKVGRGVGGGVDPSSSGGSPVKGNKPPTGGGSGSGTPSETGPGRESERSSDSRRGV